MVQGKNGHWYECKNNDWKPLAAEVLNNTWPDDAHSTCGFRPRTGAPRSLPRFSSSTKIHGAKTLSLSFSLYRTYRLGFFFVYSRPIRLSGTEALTGRNNSQWSGIRGRREQTSGQGVGVRGCGRHDMGNIRQQGINRCLHS